MAQNKGFAVVAALAFSVGTVSLVAQDQKAPPSVSQRAELTETFTIEAVDYTSRLITLKDSKGNVDTVQAGPEIKRFNELKAGDKVTFKYYESVLYAIRPKGAPAPAASQGMMQRDTSGKPGATITKQLTDSVVVEAIDLAAPSVTVTTDDGKKMSFKVKDKKNLEQLKVGDRVDITYTRGLAIKVE